MLVWFVWMADPAAWISLAVLTALLIVLGIDNVLFISVLAERLPEKQRPLARRLGLGAALGARLLMLAGIAWIMQLSTELFTLLGNSISGKDLILLSGGLFLIGKSSIEIQESLEGDDEEEHVGKATMQSVLVQVILLDAVFSIDSVITGIGLTEHIPIIVIAMLIAMAIMIASVNYIGRFIERHPSFKMLALSFLLLIGTILVTESMGYHIPKGYIYFAMAFAAFVEVLNMNIRRRKKEPTKLRNRPRTQSDSE